MEGIPLSNVPLHPVGILVLATVVRGQALSQDNVPLHPVGILVAATAKECGMRNTECGIVELFLTSLRMKQSEMW